MKVRLNLSCICFVLPMASGLESLQWFKSSPTLSLVGSIMNRLFDIVRWGGGHDDPCQHNTDTDKLGSGQQQMRVCFSILTTAPDDRLLAEKFLWDQQTVLRCWCNIVIELKAVSSEEGTLQSYRVPHLLRESILIRLELSCVSES